MGSISMEMIKALREKTGMGIADVKKALEDSSGDMEKAELELRKKAAGKAIGKSDRATGQGVIVIKTRGNTAVIGEFCCEQEPTTTNVRFVEFVEMAMNLALETNASSMEELLQQKTNDGTLQDTCKGLIGMLSENLVPRRLARLQSPAGGVFGQYIHFNKRAGAVIAIELAGADAQKVAAAGNDICMHSVALRPVAVSRDQVDQKILATERELALEKVKDKPAQMQEKIIDGMMNKYFQENVLLEQPFVKDATGKTSVKEMLDEAAKSAGGTAKVVGFIRYELGL